MDKFTEAYEGYLVDVLFDQLFDSGTFSADEVLSSFQCEHTVEDSGVYKIPTLDEADWSGV